MFVGCVLGKFQHTEARLRVGATDALHNVQGMQNLVHGFLVAKAALVEGEKLETVAILLPLRIRLLCPNDGVLANLCASLCTAERQEGQL